MNIYSSSSHDLTSSPSSPKHHRGDQLTAAASRTAGQVAPHAGPQGGVWEGGQDCSRQLRRGAVLQLGGESGHGV